MCHTAHTHFTCTHHHTTITLCAHALAPLIHTATTWPFAAQPCTHGLSRAHDITISTARSDRPCASCSSSTNALGRAAYPEIDVFDLEGSVRRWDALDAAAAAPATTTGATTGTGAAGATTAPREVGKLGLTVLVDEALAVDPYGWTTAGAKKGEATGKMRERNGRTLAKL